MSSYVGIITQQRRNNFRSTLLLILFPTILLGIAWLACYLINQFVLTGEVEIEDSIGNITTEYLEGPGANELFLQVAPWVVISTIVWFVIAYFGNVSMIRSATGAEPLQRKENPRIYNMVENLCMSCGMKTPQINIIQDDELNAFASGIDDKSFTVTLTTGIMERLNDEELEGVIAHELTHIRNRDVRLLIVSIIFVGILTTLIQVALVSMRTMAITGGERRSKDDNRGGILLILLVVLVACSIGYLFTLLTRFAISRKREFMADAGGAELTRNPMALASALRKISNNPGLTSVSRQDVAQLFIYHKLSSGRVASLFSTHPDINERIKILENF